MRATRRVTPKIEQWYKRDFTEIPSHKTNMFPVEIWDTMLIPFMDPKAIEILAQTCKGMRASCKQVLEKMIQENITPTILWKQLPTPGILPWEGLGVTVDHGFCFDGLDFCMFINQQRVPCINLQGITPDCYTNLVGKHKTVIWRKNLFEVDIDQLKIIEGARLHKFRLRYHNEHCVTMVNDVPVYFDEEYVGIITPKEWGGLHKIPSEYQPPCCMKVCGCIDQTVFLFYLPRHGNPMKRRVVAYEHYTRQFHDVYMTGVDIGKTIVIQVHNVSGLLVLLTYSLHLRRSQILVFKPFKVLDKWFANLVETNTSNTKKHIPDHYVYKDKVLQLTEDKELWELKFE